MSTRSSLQTYLTDEERAKAIDEIVSFFAEERDENIGTIAAGEVLDFFLSRLAPPIYNTGIHDARAWFEHAISTMSVDYDMLLRQ